MMITIMNVVIHAVVVPGTARRTFWLSVAASAPPIIATYSAMRLSSPEVRWAGTAYNAMWAAVSIATATLTSRIIYGLQPARSARRCSSASTRSRRRSARAAWASVYRAHHAMLRRPTAVKLLRPESRRRPDRLERFEREVQLTSALTHPNTVAIYDYGRTPDGVFYYAMEYLDGINLEDLVGARRAAARAARRLTSSRRSAARSPRRTGCGLDPPRHQAREHHPLRARAACPTW